MITDTIDEIGQLRAVSAGAGLVLLAVAWLTGSVHVAAVGAVLWVPAATLIAADLLSRGVGR